MAIPAASTSVHGNGSAAGIQRIHYSLLFEILCSWLLAEAENTTFFLLFLKCWRVLCAGPLHSHIFGRLDLTGDTLVSTCGQGRTIWKPGTCLWLGGLPETMARRRFSTNSVMVGCETFRKSSWTNRPCIHVLLSRCLIPDLTVCFFLFFFFFPSLLYAGRSACNCQKSNQDRSNLLLV